MAVSRPPKIGRPIPGPVEPSIPEPIEHVPYRKDTGIGQEKATVWAVTEPEIEPLCEWLIPKLRKRWPRLSEEGVRFWLRSAISDRFTYFIRTENVVGMAYSFTDVLEPQPLVFEKFVRSKKEATDAEKIGLYTALREWARSISAREFVFGFDTDVAMHHDTQFGGVPKYLQNDRDASNISQKNYYICSLREQ